MPDELEQLQTATPPEPTQIPEITDEDGGLAQYAEEPAQAMPPVPSETEQTFLEGATLDPNQLPDAIKPIFKKMQGAYTRKMQEIAKVREQAGIVDKFYNDRDFALNTLTQWATQNGYQIAPVGAQFPQRQQTAQPQRAGDPPAEFVETVKANLPPELQWMAEHQAKANWAAMQAILQPVIQQTKQSQTEYRQQQAGQEYDRIADEFSQTVPGWEEHEDQMSDLLEFLQGPQMRHPQYGTKHQLLYNLVTGNAAATAQVVKRMNGAAKNRPSTGMSTGRTVSNLADRVRQAKTGQDAFRLAAQAALAAGE